jgi:hypothetical protein
MSTQRSDHDPIEHRLRRLARIGKVTAPADFHDRVMASLASEGLGAALPSARRQAAAPHAGWSLSRLLDALIPVGYGSVDGSSAWSADGGAAWSAALIPVRSPWRMAFASAAFLAITALNLLSMNRLLSDGSAADADPTRVDVPALSSDPVDPSAAYTEAELLEDLGWTDYTYPNLWSFSDE